MSFIRTAMISSLRASTTLSRSSRERGLTILEAILGVAIGLSLVVGSVSYFQNAAQQKLVLDATRAAATTQALVRREMYGNGHLAKKVGDIGDYVQTIQAITFGEEDGRIVHPWGGEVELYSFGKSTFEIVLHDLPQKVCSRLTNFSTKGDGSGGQNISYSIIGGLYYPLDGRGPGLSVSDAVDACEEHSMNLPHQSFRLEGVSTSPVIG